MTQLLRYYIRMGHTRKSNCALTPQYVHETASMTVSHLHIDFGDSERGDIYGDNLRHEVPPGDDTEHDTPGLSRSLEVEMAAVVQTVLLAAGVDVHLRHRVDQSCNNTSHGSRDDV